MVIEVRKGYSWAIAYINRDFIYRVEKDLSNHDAFKTIKAYIPTVRILRKQFKGKDIFEEVPLLFNYGFFEIPNKNLEASFLQNLKEKVPAIHAWVKDTKTVITKKPSLIVGNEPLVRRDIIPVAIATTMEISNIINAQKKLGIYDKADINNLAPGSLITLRGYPFDGIDATIIRVNSKKETVEISLSLEGIIKNATVSFDNVFYTVYHGPMDERDFKEKSLDEIRERGKTRTDKYLRDDE